jgi:hypothetical protein
MLEFKAALCIRVKLPNNLNLAAHNVESVRRLRCATLIAVMTVSGVHGQTTDASYPALLLLVLQVKTGKDKPAQFNTLR